MSFVGAAPGRAAPRCGAAGARASLPSLQACQQLGAQKRARWSSGWAGRRPRTARAAPPQAGPRRRRRRPDAESEWGQPGDDWEAPPPPDSEEEDAELFPEVRVQGSAYRKQPPPQTPGGSSASAAQPAHLRARCAAPQEGDLSPLEEEAFFLQNALALVLLALLALSFGHILIKLLFVSYALVSAAVRYTILAVLIVVLSAIFI